MKTGHPDEALTYASRRHPNTRIAIIAAEWNIQIINRLKQAAEDVLSASGVGLVETYWVPGSYELPQAANLVLQSQVFDAVICLGCVIQGETRHFEFICQSVSQALQQVSIKYNKPVIFGVLTTNSLEQAIDRAGGNYGNKGAEAAITALKMIDLNNILNP